MSTEKAPILIACYTFPPAPGIGGRRWAKFAKGLAQAGHTVHVLCAEPVPGAALSPWWDDVRHERIHLYPLPRRYPRVAMQWDLTNLWNDFRYRVWMKILPRFTRGNHLDLAIFWRGPFLRKAEELIARFGIRHIIATGAPFRLLVHAAQLKERHPSLHYTADLRDPWTWGHLYDFPRLSPKRMQREKTWEALVMQQTDAVTAPSADMIEHLRGAYPQHAHKCNLVPHAVDPDDVPARTAPPHAPPRKLVFAGSWRSNPDGLAYTHEVIKALKTALRDLGAGQEVPVFDIYARPHETVGAERAVREAGMSDVIRFHGLVSVQRAGRALSEADAAMVFIAANNRHFISTKFNELFHQRIPVIHVGAPGRLSAFIVDNELGTTLDVHEVATELPAILAGQRALRINPAFDTRPVLLRSVTAQLLTLAGHEPGPTSSVSSTAFHR